MATHQQAAQTAASVRSENDQVRTPLADLVDDVLHQMIGRAVDLHHVERNAALLDPVPRSRKNLFGAVLDDLSDLAGDGAVALLPPLIGGEDALIRRPPVDLEQERSRPT